MHLTGTICGICLIVTALFGQVIDEVYAIVNDEIITYSEIKKQEQRYIQEMTAQLTGAELEKQISEMKINLLNSMIDQKVILSRAKEVYDNVDSEVEMRLNDIKQQNNLKSDAELIKALSQEGIVFEEWRKELVDIIKQQKLIYQEVNLKIVIENSEVVALYRENMAKYTIPEIYSLNCIFLNKSGYASDEDLVQKKNQISEALKSQKFEEVAKSFSELPNEEDKMFLGEFKQGELDSKLEEAAFTLALNEHSDWVDTDSGSYILQLFKKTEPRISDLKEVNEQIRSEIFDSKQQVALKEYMDRLRAESYIKIVKEYK